MVEIIEMLNDESFLFHAILFISATETKKHVFKIEKQDPLYNKFLKMLKEAVGFNYTPPKPGFRTEMPPGFLICGFGEMNADGVISIFVNINDDIEVYRATPQHSWYSDTCSVFGRIAPGEVRPLLNRTIAGFVEMKEDGTIHTYVSRDFDVFCDGICPRSFESFNDFQSPNYSTLLSKNEGIKPGDKLIIVGDLYIQSQLKKVENV
jgi:hypothetical protein